MRFYACMLFGALVVLLSGCSEEWSGEDYWAADALYPVRVEFRLGDAAFAVSDRTRSESDGRTFIPDGVLVPRSAPPRQVLSSNNWQQVNDVRIYLFRKNTAGNFVYYKPSDDNGTKQNYLSMDDFSLKFAQSPYVIWWGGDDDRNEMHSYVGQMNLPVGEYRFLALARDDRTVTTSRRLMDPNTSVATWGWTAWTEGMTRLETATLACARNAELSTTELFSGYTTESILVDATTRSFSRTITLNRAVAGILLYVEYIPATLPVHACDSEDRSSLRHVAVRSLAVVHGKTLSDQVLIARREAVAGRLTVATAASAASSAASADVASVDSQSGSSSALPFPRYVLLRADIPAQAQVQNGFYVNISPENTAHPHALLKGSFVMPQQANGPQCPGNGTETYDKTLYLVFLGYDSDRKREIALEWRPIRQSASASCDPLYYPLLANHFYSIGSRCFSIHGEMPELELDSPVDLRDETSASLTIRLEPWWNEYYGGEIGHSAPGVMLDPEWGEHPGGELYE